MKTLVFNLVAGLLLINSAHADVLKEPETIIGFLNATKDCKSEFLKSEEIALLTRAGGSLEMLEIERTEIQKSEFNVRFDLKAKFRFASGLVQEASGLTCYLVSRR